MSSPVVEFGIAGYGRAAGTEPEPVAGAARAALARAVLDAADLDLLVVAGHGHGRRRPDPAAGLAGALRVREARTLVLTEDATGLGIIAGQLVLQPEVQTVLFTTEADGAEPPAAVILRRWHPRGRWLATEEFTAAGVAAGDEHDARIVEVVERACRRAGARRVDLARVVHRADPDPLTVLGRWLDDPALEPGDLVAITGSAGGNRWYCTLVEL
ncbi:hypothetical protein Drose_16010 [Dactylosporangium roseum]|uniref:Uncharacterized protein n=1 Tax=Dactylosporangium roseum TaxID=47989 RepID=A0ABY5ZDU8_9ACTN|nr:hypothetical protein [Dactylosporangium roseum]UWZ39592.1 hypothetical protein Drose_16010 [Dactylosporangium roseum]